MKKQCKFHARKRDAKNMTNAPKLSQKGGRNREKVDKKRCPKIDAKKGALGGTRPRVRRVGRAAPSNVLNISRRLVFVF